MSELDMDLDLDLDLDMDFDLENPDQSINHSNAAQGKSINNKLLNSIPVEVTVEVGSASLTLGEVKELTSESIVLLNKSNGEPLDIKLNGKLFARGEIIVANEMYGIKVSEIIKDL